MNLLAATWPLGLLPATRKDLDAGFLLSPSLEGSLVECYGCFCSASTATLPLVLASLRSAWPGLEPLTTVDESVLLSQGG